MKSLKLLGVMIITLVIASSCEGVDPLSPVVDFAPEKLECDAFASDSDYILVNDTNKSVDYVITCQMNVRGSLIIEPGVVIEFESDAGISVGDNGSIQAEGGHVAADNIVFTGAEKIPGYWSGIYIESSNLVNRFENCLIEYGGGAKFNSNNDKGNIIVYAGGFADIMGCTIRHSPNNGVNARYSSSVLGHCDNNTFEFTEYPILVTGRQAHKIGADNTYTNNLNEVVKVLGDDIKEDVTWEQLTVPYQISFYGSSRNNLRVVSGVLTIEAGVEIEFNANCGIFVGENGGLIASGTVAEPILFTGKVKQPGYWNNIYFEFTNNPLNAISNATIEYGGNPEGDGQIYLWAKPSLTLNNVEFKHIPTCAIYIAPFESEENFSRTNLTFIDVGNDICFK